MNDKSNQASPSQPASDTDHKWAIRWEEEPRKGWWLCKQVDNQVVNKECWIGEEPSLAADRLVSWMNKRRIM